MTSFEGAMGDKPPPVPNEADAGLEIRVLGTLAVRRHGTDVDLPPSRKTRALLAYLAVVGSPQTHDRLGDMFWDAPDDPRAALRWSLSKIRQKVGTNDCGCYAGGFAYLPVSCGVIAGSFLR